MLHVRHPTLFELDKVLEANNSQKRRQPVCIMMKSQRFPQIIRQKGNLAPGQYKMDRGMGGWGWVGMRWSGGRVSRKKTGEKGRD
eukprot:symbB.v1.2.024584.t1/scaffold2306.1/size131870/6